MVRSEEYELLPHEEIRRLRNELDAMKSQTHTPHSEDVKSSIRKLSEQLQDLLSVLEKASEDLREEDKEAEIIAKKINPIFDRIASIEEQNSKIAKALVALNSMVNQKIEQVTKQAETLEVNANAINQNLQQIMSKLDDLKHETSMTRSKMEAPPPISQRSSPLPPPPIAEKKEKGFHLFKH